LASLVGSSWSVSTSSDGKSSASSAGSSSQLANLWSWSDLLARLFSALSSQSSSLNGNGVLVVLDWNVGSLLQARCDGLLSTWVSAVLAVDSLASLVGSSWSVSTSSDGKSSASSAGSSSQLANLWSRSWSA